MNTRAEIMAVITNFSGQNNHIIVPTVFLEITGEYNQAVLLNQLIYWSDKTKRKDGFFYKSYKEWEEEIYLSKYQISTAIKKLKEKGLVDTKLLKANGAPTVHYKINTNTLVDWIVKKLNNGKSSNLTMDSEETEQSNVKKLDNGKLSNSPMDSEETRLSSITEITTKNTTETTHNNTPETVNDHHDDKYHSQDYKEVLDYMQTECGFGVIQPVVYEDIKHWIDTFDKDVIKYSIEIATFQGKPFWNYAKAILQNWSQNRLKTLEDIKAFQNKKTSKPSYNRFNTNREAVTPQWFKEEQHAIPEVTEATESNTNFNQASQKKIEKVNNEDILEKIKRFRER